MSPHPYDLRERRWIPVRIMGRTVRVGLRELFLRAHEIEDLAVPVPPAATGLLRILYIMAARVATAPDGRRLDDADATEDTWEWLSLRGKILDQGRFTASEVAAYFDSPEFADRFDLFSAERPFLQDPRLPQECPSSSGVNKLVLGRPTGVNGAVWFAHHNDREPIPVDPAEAVWHLIAQLYFGPAGQCTPRRITDVKPGNGDAGPLRKTVSFHPWGHNLFTSLILGIPFPSDEEIPADTDAPWEREALPDPLGRIEPFSWPGGLLAGRARHSVLLIPSPDGELVVDAYVTWSSHALAPEAHDPYVVRNVSKDGRLYSRSADSDRAVWRDLDALLLKGSSGHGFHRPRIFEHLVGLPAHLADSVQVRAYGFDQDGQQKDSSWYAATTPAVLRWLEETDEEKAVQIFLCHTAAEEVGRQLQYAAKLAWAETNSPPRDGERVRVNDKKPGPWAAPAGAAYWPGAERLFWDLVTRDQDVTSAEPNPHARFVGAAESSLRSAVGLASSDLRVARALSHAVAVLRKIVPTPLPAVAGGPTQE